MKIKCTAIFYFDTGEQTLDELKEYLKNCPGESLEWMDDTAKFTFEKAQDDDE